MTHIVTSLTHSSYANEVNEKIPENEKYEFLGDSILGFVTAVYLFNKYPSKTEGELTRIRSLIVCEKNLSMCAKKVELGKYIFLGKGETLSKGYNKASILSDCIEALIGGIFLDKGMTYSKEFIIKYIIEPYFEKNKEVNIKDYKSMFQETVQKKGEVMIKYDTIKQDGPDHNKTFHVNVSINDEIFGNGTGKSKKEAEQMAAKEALKKVEE